MGCRKDGCVQRKQRAVRLCRQRVQRRIEVTTSKPLASLCKTCGGNLIYQKRPENEWLPRFAGASSGTSFADSRKLKNLIRPRPEQILEPCLIKCIRNADVLLCEGAYAGRACSHNRSVRKGFVRHGFRKPVRVCRKGSAVHVISNHHAQNRRDHARSLGL